MFRVAWSKMICGKGDDDGLSWNFVGLEGSEGMN